MLKEAGDQVFLGSRDGLVAQLQNKMEGYLGKVLRGCSSSPFSDSQCVSAMIFNCNDDTLQIPRCGCRGQEGIPSSPSWFILSARRCCSQSWGGIEALPRHIHGNDRCVPAPKCNSFL